MHVVAGQVEGNQALEDDGPAGEGRRQEDEEACSGAAIGHHVENSAEASGLLKDTGDIAIEGVEKA